MPAEPPIRKFPTEIFGHPYVEHGTDARRALDTQNCPFLSDECKKPRKSEPHIKVGVCSVGYKGKFLPDHRPIVICPHRFLEGGTVFAVVADLYLPGGGQNVEWVSEVSMGAAGSVDYVAVQLDAAGKIIEDFLCVEFQAAGTTGTPWPAVLEFKESRRFSSGSYDYGINWANEFVKTMMQQVYKKGRVIQGWNRKIIFVVQDVAIEYLRSAVDVSRLREADDDDPIHFVTFGMTWESVGGWKLRHNGSFSTDLEGVNLILGGATAEDFPTEQNFMGNIYSKGRSEGRF